MQINWLVSIWWERLVVNGLMIMKLFCTNYVFLQIQRLTWNTLVSQSSRERSSFSLALLFLINFWDIWRKQKKAKVSHILFLWSEIILCQIALNFKLILSRRIRKHHLEKKHLQFNKNPKYIQQMTLEQFMR